MYLPLFVGVLFFAFVLLCTILCPFYFGIHLDEVEKAGCLAIIVLQMYCYCNVMWLFLTVPWVGLQCVIVVFPDHTHLLFVIHIIMKYVYNI